MEENRSRGKRPFLEDDSNSSKPPPQKRVRFPKGKKVKAGDEVTTKHSVVEDEGPVDLTEPHLAAKERAKRRSQFTSQLFIDDDKGTAEVTYQEDENFVEDGIQIDPFNLDKEREEGYFDAAGNFVEYVNENEIKDAWLDSIEVDTTLASRIPVSTNGEDDNRELSSDEFGRIKRRIADALEPGENVLQALKRLKGNSSNRKEKMSAETKHIFDQLTEDAMLLMENGEYDVYHERQEVFQREAEGYERLAFARGGGTAATAQKAELGKGSDAGVASSIFHDTAVGPSVLDESRARTSNGDEEEYDMFAEDDGHTASNPATEGANSDSHVNGTAAPSSAGDSQSDYVYDENSGYYYSSSLGYYYDPSTGFYCSAASGQWYSFNEETGTYEEIRTDATSAN